MVNSTLTTHGAAALTDQRMALQLGPPTMAKRRGRVNLQSVDTSVELMSPQLKNKTSGTKTCTCSSCVHKSKARSEAVVKAGSVVAEEKSVKSSRTFTEGEFFLLVNRTTH